MSERPAKRAELQNEATRLVRSYVRDPEAPDRTNTLREIARRFVSLRECFLTSDGEPDWRGATYAYKRAVGEIYSMAGPSREEQYRVANTVRYHVGEVLREQLDEATIEELGLRQASPRERSVEKRERERELLDVMRGPGEGGPIDPLRGAAAAYGALSHIAAEDVAALTEAQRRRLSASLTKVSAECRRVRGAVRDAGG